MVGESEAFIMSKPTNIEIDMVSVAAPFNYLLNHCQGWMKDNKK